MPPVDKYSGKSQVKGATAPAAGPTGKYSGKSSVAGAGARATGSECPNCHNNAWQVDRVEDDTRVVTRQKCSACNYVDSATEKIELKNK